MTKTILALGPLLPAEMEQLEKHFKLIRLWQEPDMEDALRRYKSEVQGLLSTYNTSVSRRLLEALPNLEIVAQFGVGVENIDLQAAADLHLAVTNTPDVLTDDTADIALALVLAVARRICEADMFVRVGKWGKGAMPLATSLTGKTAGIVGLGRIGQAIARRCEAFSMKVLYTGPREKLGQSYEFIPDLLTMAKRCDFLILACPGGAETEGIINYDILESLGPKGFLINIARGSVVNEDDLLVALRNKVIGGAGLDVYRNEPHVPEALFSMDNVVLLPHVGSATVETRARMGQLVIDNLLAHFNGDPLKTPVAINSNGLSEG